MDKKVLFKNYSLELVDQYQILIEKVNKTNELYLILDIFLLIKNFNPELQINFTNTFLDNTSELESIYFNNLRELTYIHNYRRHITDDTTVLIFTDEKIEKIKEIYTKIFYEKITFKSKVELLITKINR